MYSDFWGNFFYRFWLFNLKFVETIQNVAIKDINTVTGLAMKRRCCNSWSTYSVLWIQNSTNLVQSYTDSILMHIFNTIFLITKTVVSSLYYITSPFFLICMYHISWKITPYLLFMVQLILSFKIFVTIVFRPSSGSIGSNRLKFPW